MDCNERFVQRMASTYLQKYKQISHEAATVYIERMVGHDPVLSDKVRRAVEEIIKSTLGGNNDNTKA